MSIVAMLRGRSLTGEGGGRGLQNGREGVVKFYPRFYPYKKGGGGKNCSHAEGGGAHKRF